MSRIHTVKTVSLIRGLFTGAAVVAGLALCTGQLSAATIASRQAGVKGFDSVSNIRAVSGEQAFSLADRPDVFARAGSARDGLGFPVGAARAGRHVHDTIQGVDYDEVAEMDSSGKPVALTQFGGDGRLMTAVRFDSPPPAGLGSVTSDAATKAAQRALVSAGITVAGQARTEANASSGGWDVHWARTQGSYAVRGDETRVHVWQDGRVESVAHVDHALAAAPSAVLAKADAGTAVKRQCDTWFSGAGSGYNLQAMDLEWVGPNAAFDPGKLGVASSPYRLAWVANVKPSGQAAESVRLVTLYIDAETGAVIGGDVVE